MWTWRESLGLFEEILMPLLEHAHTSAVTLSLKHASRTLAQKRRQIPRLSIFGLRHLRSLDSSYLLLLLPSSPSQLLRCIIFNRLLWKVHIIMAVAMYLERNLWLSVLINRPRVNVWLQTQRVILLLWIRSSGEKISALTLHSSRWLGKILHLWCHPIILVRIKRLFPLLLAAEMINSTLQVLLEWITLLLFEQVEQYCFIVARVCIQWILEPSWAAYLLVCW